jgi:glycosyltransferase involved in cell wall biosynthesis
LKICLVDPSLFTPTYDRALMEALRGLGHEVRLYSIRPSPGTALLADVGVVPHFHRFPTRSPFSRLPKRLVRLCKGLGHSASMYSLSTALETWRPDVIHFQWTPVPLVDRWLLPRVHRIAPVIFTAHDILPFNGNPSSRIQNIGATKVLRRFDGVIVHTERARLRLEEIAAELPRVRRIPHGLLYAAEMEFGATVRSHPSEGKLVILMFGKLKPYKGLDVLIRAISLMPASATSRAQVRVVGKPYMNTRALIALAESLGVAHLVDFEFRFLEDQEIAGLLKSASIVVLPYRQVEASGVLMAAVAAGRPVVATNVGGFGEILTDGQDALLVPGGDAKPLAFALQRIIQDDALRHRLGDGVRRLRTEIPTWPDIAQATHALYREVIEARYSAPPSQTWTRIRHFYQASQSTRNDSLKKQIGSLRSDQSKAKSRWLMAQGRAKL